MALKRAQPKHSRMSCGGSAEKTGVGQSMDDLSRDVPEEVRGGGVNPEIRDGNGGKFSDMGQPRGQPAGKGLNV